MATTKEQLKNLQDFMVTKGFSIEVIEKHKRIDHEGEYYLIAKGSYSHVYQKVGDNNNVYIVSTDACKVGYEMGFNVDDEVDQEILPYLYQEVDSKLLENYSIYATLYKMKKLVRIRAPKSQLNSEDWAFYKELKLLSKNAKYRGYEYLDELRRKIDDMPVNISYRNTLHVMIDALANSVAHMESIRLDPSPRNIMLDPDTGRVVLTDIFFSTEEMKIKKARPGAMFTF